MTVSRCHKETTARLIDDVQRDSVHAAEVSRLSRFNAIMVDMREIATYIADQPAESYTTYETAVSAFRDQLLAGHVDAVLASLSVIQDDSDIELEMSRSDEHSVSSDADDQVDDCS